MARKKARKSYPLEFKKKAVLILKNSSLLTDGFFTKKENGECVFYPFGICGSGYILENSKIEEKARLTIRNFQLAAKVALVLLFITGPTSGLIYTILIFFLYRAIIRNFLDGMQKAPETLKFTQSLDNKLGSTSTTNIVILTIGNLILFGAAIVSLFSEKVSMAVSISGVFLFGISLYGSIYMLVMRAIRR